MKNASKNQGFSLIELIVVVAIMAVLVVILAPALLQYNERSRAERDNSAMDEVVNAVQLALADAQIYDEVVAFSTVDNISCYVDTDSEANYTRIVTKSNPDGVDQYTFDSTSRQLDETPYYAAGNMRGVTLTFAPDKGSNGSTFDFKQGVVNQYVQIKGNHRVGAMHGLYGRLNSSVGESLEVKSQTYRNSEYTVFIRLGSTGGNDESKQNSIQTYGQWSGTNLPAEVSYKLVSDRSIGDPGNQIVEINDSKWNSTNGTKITVKPGDLNGGGSFTPGTETGNKDRYTAEDFSADEKGIYAYLVNGNTLVLRNSPRENMSDVTKEYGMLDANTHDRKWTTEKLQIEYVDIETPILPKRCVDYFNGCQNLIEIKNLKNLCMDECTNTSHMFQSCSRLTELDVSNFDTSNVTNLSWMFYGCSGLTELDVSNFNTANVTNMGAMFQNCSSITKLDVSNFNTANVTNMSSMFRGCKNLTKLDLSSFNTTNVTNMEDMFSGCNALAELDVSNFNTANVTKMRGMFCNCSNLTELDLSNFDTTNATHMPWMFMGCSNMTKLDLSSFNTEKVTNMGDMFKNCGKLTELDVSSFKTPKVTEMGGMFYGCGNLTKLNVSGFNTSKVTSMEGMFQACYKLTDIDLSVFDTTKVTSMKDMFRSCYNLKTEITINGCVTSYVSVFSSAANKTGALITVNYTAETSNLVDAMIATKSANSNVVKGQLVE